MTIMALACENSHLPSLLGVWDISLEGLLAKSPSGKERVVSSHCQVVVSEQDSLPADVLWGSFVTHSGEAIPFKTSRVVGTAQRKVCGRGGRGAEPYSSMVSLYLLLGLSLIPLYSVLQNTPADLTT